MIVDFLRLDGHFKVHPSVLQALAEKKPVVALESTIITHGMPYPKNLRYSTPTVYYWSYRPAYNMSLTFSVNFFSSSSVQQNRWSQLSEQKEPLQPRLEWSRATSMLVCHQRSWTTWPRARAPWRCLVVIFHTSSAKWDTLVNLWFIYYLYFCTSRHFLTWLSFVFINKVNPKFKKKCLFYSL